MNNTYPAGLGEPLNIILSGDSDDDVLVQSTENGGFLNYMLYAFAPFSTELRQEANDADRQI